MTTVSAKALWWDEPQVCTCAAPDEDFSCPHDRGGWPSLMMAGEIDGWRYLTDRYVFLQVAHLGQLPLGYDEVLALQPMPVQALEGLGEWLAARVLPAPSNRVFGLRRIDPLEQAGFLVRPLERVKEAHAICLPDLTVVGLVNPIIRTREQELAGRVAS